MMPAIIFGTLSALLFLLLLFFLDLLLFCRCQTREFLRRGGEIEYLIQVENKHKKAKHPIKKNVLLYFAIKSLFLQGKRKQAESLLPFLKEDKLLGVEKKDLF